MKDNRLLRYVGVALGLLVLGKAMERASKPAHGTLLGRAVRPTVTHPAAPAQPVVGPRQPAGVGWDINLAAVLRRTGGDPYADGTRIWYECQQLTQR